MNLYENHIKSSENHIIRIFIRTFEKYFAKYALDREMKNIDFMETQFCFYQKSYD